MVQDVNGACYGVVVQVCKRWRLVMDIYLLRSQLGKELNNIDI